MENNVGGVILFSHTPLDHFKQHFMKINLPFARMMLLSISLLIVPALTTGGRPVDQPSLTLILVRHADKQVVPPENKDPDLSAEGVARAEQLARMFGDTGISAIYATQYKRTQQTVKPLAEKLGLPVITLDTKQTPELVKQLHARKNGDIVFIAGHDTTVPEIIAAMGGPQMPTIPSTEY